MKSKCIKENQLKKKMKKKSKWKWKFSFIFQTQKKRFSLAMIFVFRFVVLKINFYFAAMSRNEEEENYQIGGFMWNLCVLWKLTVKKVTWLVDLWTKQRTLVEMIDDWFNQLVIFAVLINFVWIHQVKNYNNLPIAKIIIEHFIRKW